MKTRIVSMLLAVAMMIGLAPATLAETGLQPAAGSRDTVTVVVENTTYTDADAPWQGRLVNAEVDLNDESTMLSCIQDAVQAAGENMEADNTGFITSVNGLSNQGGPMSGWFVFLNDWATAAGTLDYKADEPLKNGDVIQLRYSVENYGGDLGADFYNCDKTIKTLAVSAGELTPAFSAAQKYYGLTVDGTMDSVTLTPTATNKQFQVWIFSEGEKYRATDAILVEDDTLIEVVCGDPSWPTGMYGSEDIPAETYFILVDKGNERYPVNISHAAGGVVTASHFRALPGETVTLKVAVNPGYVFKELKVSGGVTVNKLGNDYTFTMPESDVTVTHSYQKLVTGISLGASSRSVNAGGSITFSPGITPGDATDKSLTWTSSKESVATVDTSGKVRAKKAGKTTITVAATDGSGVTATCNVTVKQPVTGVTMKVTRKTLKKGKTYTFKATVSPSNADVKTLKWTSSKNTVASINKMTGEVKAKKNGTTTITAKANNGKKATAKLRVGGIAVKSVKLNKKSASVKKNKTITLKATVKPAKATYKGVTWSSSDKKIAKVTAKSSGKSAAVKGVAKGSARITVKTKDGNKKATCTITVK